LNERGREPPPAAGPPEPDWRDERPSPPESSEEPLWSRLREAPSRLSGEQRLAGAAAAGILLSLFLPWWRDPVFGLSYMALNRFGWIELALLLISTSVLVTLFRRAEGRVFHLPLSDGTLTAGAGLWCCVLLLARALGPPTRDAGNRTLDYDPRWGVFFCLLCSATLAAAGIMARRRRHPGEPESLAADEDAEATFTG
jgi:hypothetical protein